MTTRYLIMVPRPIRCEACDGHGHGVIFDDPEDDEFSEPCRDCDGTGRSQEVRWEPNNGQTYDEPGKAAGVAKRYHRLVGRGEPEAGRAFKILEIDLDLCDAVTKGWPVEAQAAHALERAAFWVRRAVELGQRAHVPIEDTQAGDTLAVALDAVLEGRMDAAREILAGVKPEPARLSPEDWTMVRGALDRAIRQSTAPPIQYDPNTGLVEAAPLADDVLRRARDLLARLDADAALEDLHRDRVKQAAETAEQTRAWAFGESGRRCFRDTARPEPDARFARTACGDRVPIGATTTDPAEVACGACDAAMAPREV